MKGHHRHHHRETGGVNDARLDLEDRPEERTNARKIDAEAMEKKHGGSAHGHKRHGKELHHSSCKCEKCGGRAERRHGGKVHHHKSHHEHHAEHHGSHVEIHHHHKKRGGLAKHLGAIHGEHAHHHAGMRRRKSGGRTGSDSAPFSSARHGTPAPGRRLEMEMD